MMADDDDDRASNSAGGSAEHKISSQTGGVWIWQPEQECQVCAAMQVGQHSRQGRSTWLGLCSDAGTTNRWPGPGPGVQPPGQECMAGSMQRCRYHKPVARARTGCTLRCRWHETAASAGAQGRVYAAMQVARTGGQGRSAGPGVRCDAGATRRRPAQEHRAGCRLHETSISPNRPAYPQRVGTGGSHYSPHMPQCPNILKLGATYFL
ncbi:hypothetical protein JYU34_007438 [Plutella xylostella]|uniref:Uncharacterized protein n=1 Tax=Plutella xylostella TaxID=51655 RepID=A0ABQ7QQF4_PLUXY|nr:hypothetical protein JYU34_007438 [Plutella xylostella]